MLQPKRHEGGPRKSACRINDKWQRLWDNSTKGRWTYRLIPNVSTRIERKHGEVNFHLTQFFSGHGCFRKFLHRFGHADSPYCPECSDTEETPEHVVFDCPRYDPVRNRMLSVSGLDTTPENIVQKMRCDEATWNAVSSAVTQIALALQRKWREDQRAIALPTGVG